MRQLHKWRWWRKKMKRRKRRREWEERRTKRKRGWNMQRRWRKSRWKSKRFSLSGIRVFKELFLFCFPTKLIFWTAKAHNFIFRGWLGMDHVSRSSSCTIVHKRGKYSYFYFAYCKTKWITALSILLGSYMKFL